MPRPVTTTRLRPLGPDPFSLTPARLHPEPTVDEEHGPRHEPGLVGAEEADGSRDVLRVAEAPERCRVEHRLRRLLGEHVGQARAHVAGRDDVRTHVAAAELARERLREADDPRLRRRVVRLPEVAVHSDDRRDVHDRPAALLHHRPGGRARHV